MRRGALTSQSVRWSRTDAKNSAVVVLTPSKTMWFHVFQVIQRRRVATVIQSVSGQPE
jgi:hypothetical protein